MAIRDDKKSGKIHDETAAGSEARSNPSRRKVLKGIGVATGVAAVYSTPTVAFAEGTSTLSGFPTLVSYPFDEELDENEQTSLSAEDGTASLYPVLFQQSQSYTMNWSVDDANVSVSPSSTVVAAGSAIEFVDLTITSTISDDVTTVLRAETVLGFEVCNAAIPLAMIKKSLPKCRIRAVGSMQRTGKPVENINSLRKNPVIVRGRKGAFTRTVKKKGADPNATLTKSWIFAHKGFAASGNVTYSCTDSECNVGGTCESTTTALPAVGKDLAGFKFECNCTT